MEYEQIAFDELKRWQKEMMRKPSILNKLSKKVQTKLNSYIPEKIHKAITHAIKQMVRGVLFGAQYATRQPSAINSLLQTEDEIKKLIKTHRTTAAAEGEGANRRLL